MSYDNVTLWFAKDSNGNVITIEDINDENKNDEYLCPMCGSDLIPKATKSLKVTSHFAHVDVSKCSESMIHWWFKHRFLEKEDIFSIVSDKERQYIVKEVLTEQRYEVNGEIYNPDMTILTKCGNIVYFEMAFSNHKKVKDYLDRWLELKNIVVEVDIKVLMNKDKIPTFKALFYDGKCFNVKKNDTYYNTIGKYKEEKLSGNVNQELKNRIQKLDWFWNDVLRYRNNEIDIESVINVIDCIDKEDKEIVYKVLSKPSCVDILNQYKDVKSKKTYKKVAGIAKEYFGDDYSKYVKLSTGLVGYNPSGRTIEILDLSDKGYVCFDAVHDDVTSGCIRYFKSNINKIKEIEAENKWSVVTESFINKIKYDKEIIEFKDKLHINSYDITIWFSYHFKTKYILNIMLKYLNSGVTAKIFELEVREDTKIKEVIDFIKSNVNNYILNLDKFHKSDELNQIVEFLNSKYRFIAKCRGLLWLEDTYELEVKSYIEDCSNLRYFEKRYYFSNNGLMKNWRNEDINILLDNIDFIKDYLVKDLNTYIKNETDFNCTDCREKFTMELKEIKFFNEKGFNFPNRCKSCRDKRKKNK